MKEAIQKIKDAWWEAKLICGDHKGLGRHRFTMAAKLGINEMKVAFDAMSPIRKLDGKHEVTSAIYGEDGTDVYGIYTIKDLIDECNRYKGQKVEIWFSYNVWNKWGTDTVKNESLFQREFQL